MYIPYSAVRSSWTQCSVYKFNEKNVACLKGFLHTIFVPTYIWCVHERKRIYTFNLQRLCSTETSNNFLFLSFMEMVNGQETKLQHPMAYVNWHFICIKHFVRHFAPFLIQKICDVENFFFDTKTLHKNVNYLWNIFIQAQIHWSYIKNENSYFFHFQEYKETWRVEGMVYHNLHWLIVEHTAMSNCLNKINSKKEEKGNEALWQWM